MVRAREVRGARITWRADHPQVTDAGLPAERVSRRLCALTAMAAARDARPAPGARRRSTAGMPPGAPAPAAIARAPCRCTAGTIASADAPAISTCSDPACTRTTASATVDTMNDIPSAWTSSSLSSSSACRYGTAGITNTPVAAVIMPVAMPTTADSQRSPRAGTDEAKRAQPDDRVDDERDARAPWSRAVRPFPAGRGLRRRCRRRCRAASATAGCSSAARCGPTADCQRLVTSDGTTRSAAACAGGMTTASSPDHHGRKPEPDHALHEAGEQKGREGEGEQQCLVGHAGL